MSDPVEIGLWVWSLDVDADRRGRLASLLSRDERTRAARLVFDRDRERFIVGRGRLREILSQHLGIDAATLQFSYSQYQKPFLEGSGLRFNVSHSEGVAALVVGREFDIGVDVEFVRPLKEDVAGRYFSQAEVAALAELPTDDQLGGFYRCWTRKEAVIKAIGDGLSHPLNSFDVSVETIDEPLLERLDGDVDATRHWRLAHFEPIPGFIGAVACRTGGRSIRVSARQVFSAEA